MAATAPGSPSAPKDTSPGQTNPEASSSKGDVTTNAASGAAAPSEKVVSPLTYNGTKNSEAYRNAKEKLNAGDFEGSMEIIEMALKTTMSQLPDTTDELHESLGPLYYLYGTTLLYSVEESTEGAEASVMVQQQGEDGSDGGGDAPQGDSAEDLQIAWENLDTARSVVSRIVTSSHVAKASSSDPDDAEARDLVLDLAQIHLRLGDLQRANGNYAEAIVDYDRTLEIRLAALGVFDRRVADTHYSLGMSCLGLAVEGEKLQQKGEPEAPTETGQQSRALSQSEIAEYREKAILHYLSCGKSLGGIIGLMCGENPEEIATVATNKGQAVGSSGKTDAQCKGKGQVSEPTGEEKKPEGSESIYSSSSRSLEAVRKMVAHLVPTNQEDQGKVADIRELLDEIQEAIDSAEEDMKGIMDVKEMKAKAEAQIESEDKKMPGMGATIKDNIGGQTTVGFGAPTTVGFGAATTTLSKQVEPTPVMVVKKKRKKRDDDEGGNKSNSKKAHVGSNE